MTFCPSLMPRLPASNKPVHYSPIPVPVDAAKRSLPQPVPSNGCGQLVQQAANESQRDNASVGLLRRRLRSRPRGMCERYGRQADKQRIAEWMQSHNTSVFNDDDSVLAPSYNIAPQTMQPVLRLARETHHRELTAMHSGLIPYWSKDGKVGFSTINAKAETITTSPVFREAIKRRLCLVPADLFYQWRRVDAKTKQPYAIGMKDDGLFAFAGLCEGLDQRVSSSNLRDHHHGPK
jgi:hypothetical protein